MFQITNQNIRLYKFINIHVALLRLDTPASSGSRKAPRVRKSRLLSYTSKHLTEYVYRNNMRKPNTATVNKGGIRTFINICSMCQFHPKLTHATNQSEKTLLWSPGSSGNFQEILLR